MVEKTDMELYVQNMVKASSIFSGMIDKMIGANPETVEIEKNKIDGE